MNITGSLQIKNGVYYSVIRIPDANNKPKQIWKTTKISATGKSQRESKLNLSAAQKELQKQIIEYETKNTVYSGELFIQWMDKWLKRKKGSIRESTWLSYEFYVSKHIKPFFEPLGLKVVDVTPSCIQSFVDKEQDAGLKGNTIGKSLIIIRGVLNEAVKFNVMPFNPCDRVTTPKSKKYRSKFYTAEQSNLLISCLPDEPIKSVVIIGLFLGLRRSEILGLRWQDVDFSNNLVYIRNTVVQFTKRIEEEDTKSESSKRDLVMAPTLKAFLQHLYAEQAQRKLLLGAAYDNGDHVCVWPDGRPLRPDYVTRKFSKLLKQNGLPRIRFHELRHTAGSLLYDQSKNIKEVQEYLGHQDVSTTMNIYTHTLPERQQEAANIMGSVLQFPSNQNQAC